MRDGPRSETGGRWWHGGAATIAIALILACPVLPAKAEGQEPAAGPEPTSVWLYALYKTATYRAATNLTDAALYATVLAGEPAATGLFAAANVASAAMTYYGYEVGWNLFGPTQRDGAGEALRVGTAKTLL